MSEIKNRVVKKGISYPGIEEPKTITEIRVEIYGLKNVIKIAEEQISRYEQVLALIDLEKEAAQHASQAESTSQTKKGTEGKD